MAVDAQELEQAAKLPYSERVAHKNWKIRAEVYADIRSACERAASADDLAIPDIVALLAKASSDSNAAALDKALEAVLSYLSCAGEAAAARLAAPFCAALVKSNLKQRPATVKMCSEICLALVELEQADTVVEHVVRAFGDKVFKVVVAALEILNQALSAFGPKVVAPQPLLKALPALFDAKQEPVRDSVKKLTVELAGWLGAEAVQGTLLDKMPELMRKDLEKLLAEAGNARKRPQRFTRHEAARRPAEAPAAPAVEGAQAPSVGAAPAEEEEDAQGLDAYDFAEAVGVLQQLDKGFWDGLGAAKWSERRDALQRLKALASAPKIAPGDFGDVLRELKKVIVKDSNVVCVAEAVACLGRLAKGLRRDFASSARAFFPVLLDKYRDKNSNVCAQCDEALGFCTRYCVVMVNVVEDFVAALDHKNPKVKLCTIKLLQSCVAGSTKAAAAKAHAALLPAVATAAGDPVPDIREAALHALVAFAQKAGSLGAIDKHIGKVDDARKKRLEELWAAVRSGSAASAQPASKGPGVAPQALSPKNTNRPAPARTAPAAKKPARPAVSQPAAPAIADDDDAALQSGTLSRAEAEEQLVALAGEAVVKGLQSAAWKERLAGMEALQQRLAGMAAPEQAAAASAVIQGLAYLPGWAEKNFQVLAKAFEVIAALAAGEGVSVTKRDAFLAVSGLVDKMADIKLKGPAGEALLALSVAVGPQFVCTQLHKKAAAHKNPKVLSESLAWMGRAAEDFGLAQLDVRLLLEWLKADLASTNAGVRNAATGLAGVCHRQLGPGLAGQLREHVKPALMAALEDAFLANPQQAVVPTRVVRRRGARAAPARAGAAAAVTGAADEDAAPTAVNPDDLLPRVDIAALVTPRILSSLSSANWKERNAALEEARLSDSNANLVARALCLAGELAAATGAAWDRVGRPLLTPALLGLADKKKQVRDGVVAMLEAWAGIAPAERLLPQLADYLASPKSSGEGKAAALRWATSQAEAGKLERCLDAAARAAAAGVLDKALDAREAGTAFMLALLQVHGQAEVQAALRSLDAAAAKAAGEALAKVAGSKDGLAVLGRAQGTGAAASADAPRPVQAAAAQPQGPASRAPAPVASRPVPVAAALPVGLEALLAVSEKKDERARRGRFRTSKFEAPREDEEEAIEQELGTLCSDQLRGLLFASDFRKHVEAAELLIAALPAEAEAELAALDLLLRWAVVRLCDPHGNTTCLLRVLELCQALFGLLASSGAQLSQYEALCCLPCLVEKAGHNQDRIRALHRQLLRTARLIYPAPRLVEHLTAGLASKNNRTRVECAELLGELLAEDGLVAFDRAKEKPFPALAQLVSERDKGIRAAALGTLELLHSAEGSAAAWRAIGSISDQQRSLIEERFRHSEKQAARAAAASRQATGLSAGSSQRTTDDAEVAAQYA
ncbi:hypothetical protein WJX81_005118, partial [Elliptochloris bilobata]